MTGTVKRSKRERQRRQQHQQQQQQQQRQRVTEDGLAIVVYEDELVYDVDTTLTRDQIKLLEKRVHDKYHDRCFCGLRRGPHVLALSLLALPFVLAFSTFSAFYLGTLSWYSAFNTLTSGSCCQRLAAPLVLLAYPLWILPVTIFLGIYGGLASVSWYLDSWLHTLAAPDGGFFAWFCSAAGAPEASPYQVIVLAASDYERPLTEDHHHHHHHKV